MNGLQIFKNNQFGEIRTQEIDGKIYFVGSDVAKALGYINPRDAIIKHCKGVVKRDILTEGGKQQMNLIPEGDLYRLTINSKLENAEKFEVWVFDEVLPSIRQHGAYMTPETIEKALLNPDTIIEIATRLKAAQERVRTLEEAREKDKPKILFAEAVTSSKTSILVGELAKILRQNGVKIGQNRLFEWLREKGYLINRKGTDYNMPTQYSMELGLFEIKETVITHADGHTVTAKTPKITGKGQIYFINKFKETKIA